MASTLDMIEEATYNQYAVSFPHLLMYKSHRSDEPGRQHEVVHPAWQLKHQHPLDARLSPGPVIRAASHSVVSDRGLGLVLCLCLTQSEVCIQVT